MWQSKRIVKKQRQKRKSILFIFLFIFLLAVILLISIVSYQLILYKTSAFLNPVAKQKVIFKNSLSQLLKNKNIDFSSISIGNGVYNVRLKDRGANNFFD